MFRLPRLRFCLSAISVSFMLMLASVKLPAIIQINQISIALSRAAFNSSSKRESAIDSRGKNINETAFENSKNPHVLWLSAQFYDHTGKVEKSLSIYQSILKQYPFRAELVKGKIAKIFESQKNFGLAAAYWSQVKACPHLIQIIREALNTENLEAALPAANVVSSSCSLDAEAVILIALSLHRSGNSAEALEFLNQRMIASSQPDPEWLVLKARILEDLGDWGGSLAVCEQSMKKFPGNPALIRQYARGLLYGKNQPQKAIPILQNSMDLEPGNVWSYMMLGDAYIQLNDDQAAVQAYQAGASALPESEIPFIWLARFYSQKKENTAAEYYFNQALLMQPNSCLAHQEYGNFLANQGHLQDAVLEYRAALRVTPEDISILLALAHAYQVIGEESQAEDIYQQIIHLAPTNREAIDALSKLP